MPTGLSRRWRARSLRTEGRSSFSGTSLFSRASCLCGGRRRSVGLAVCAPSAAAKGRTRRGSLGRRGGRSGACRDGSGLAGSISTDCCTSVLWRRRGTRRHGASSFFEGRIGTAGKTGPSRRGKLSRARSGRVSSSLCLSPGRSFRASRSRRVFLRATSSGSNRLYALGRYRLSRLSRVATGRGQARQGLCCSTGSSLASGTDCCRVTPSRGLRTVLTFGPRGVGGGLCGVSSHVSRLCRPASQVCRLYSARSVSRRLCRGSSRRSLCATSSRSSVDFVGRTCSPRLRRSRRTNCCLVLGLSVYLWERALSLVFGLSWACGASRSCRPSRTSQGGRAKASSGSTFPDCWASCSGGGLRGRLLT